jgi:hypothetical protein
MFAILPDTVFLNVSSRITQEMTLASAILRLFYGYDAHTEVFDKAFIVREHSQSPLRWFRFPRRDAQAMFQAVSRNGFVPLDIYADFAGSTQSFERRSLLLGYLRQLAPSFSDTADSRLLAIYRCLTTAQREAARNDVFVPISSLQPEARKEVWTYLYSTRVQRVGAPVAAPRGVRAEHEPCTLISAADFNRSRLRVRLDRVQTLFRRNKEGERNVVALDLGTKLESDPRYVYASCPTTVVTIEFHSSEGHVFGGTYPYFETPVEFKWGSLEDVDGNGG